METKETKKFNFTPKNLRQVAKSLAIAVAGIVLYRLEIIPFGKLAEYGDVAAPLNAVVGVAMVEWFRNR